MGHYSVYNLIGQYIVSELPERYGGKKIQGVVENIYRDPILKQIELKLKKGKKYLFREPSKIEEYEKNVTFTYLGGEEISDEEILSEHKEKAFKGMGIDKGLKEAAMSENCQVIFEIKEKPKERKRRRKLK